MTALSRAPVLIVESEEAASKARALGLHVLVAAGGVLAGDNIRLPLPAERFSVASTVNADSLGRWMDVLNDLKHSVVPEPIYMVSVSHPLRELFLVADALDLFPFGVLFDSLPARITAFDYGFLGSARTFVFDDEETEQQLRKMFVSSYSRITLDELGDNPQSIEVEQFALAPYSGGAHLGNRESRPLRVLVVAYFSGPCRTVGVQRVNYWLEALGSAADGVVEVDIVTSIAWSSSAGRVHVVPDRNHACLFERDGSVEEWAQMFAKSEQQDARSFNTMSTYWRVAIEQYFDARDEHYDVVLISGNPFAVFDFANYAKRRWYAKVVLDYRDPFANNPRMKYSEEAREKARYVERGYNYQADLITVVNDDCVGLVEGGEDTLVLVVPNGFDERAVPPPKAPFSDTDGKIHLVHAGTLFADRSPVALLGALDPEKHQLHHVGSMAGVPEGDNEALVLHGTLPYEQTLSVIGSGQCGVVFVTETGFETPTKVYDYLAYGLDILIVTSGPIGGGALASALKGYPNVYWAANEPESLAAFVANYNPSQSRQDEKAYAFSRHSSSCTLIAELNRIVSGYRTTPGVKSATS